MTGITIINEHIRTSSGPRFAIYNSEEERRVALIEYYNEVHCDSTAERLPDDTDLEDVVDAIEEFEDVSAEEDYVTVPPFWVLVTDDDQGGASIDLFKTRREALDSLAGIYDPDTDTSAMSDDDLSEHLVDVLEQAGGSWFVLEEKEIPA